MFGINRDNMGRFAKSTIVRKFIKYSFLIGIVWFSIWSFKHQFNIIHQDGIYGIVTEKRWHDIHRNTVKAQAYDTIPDTYLYMAD